MTNYKILPKPDAHPTIKADIDKHGPVFTIVVRGNPGRWNGCDCVMVQSMARNADGFPWAGWIPVDQVTMTEEQQ